MRFLSLLLLGMSGLLVQEAWAVWGTGGATCTAQSKAAGTSLACTVATENLDAGNVAVLWFAGDNLATTDVTTALLTSVTDSVGGNTWTVQQCFTNGQGAAAAGATTCVATSVLTNALATGSTITANFTSITAKAIVVREFTIGAGSTIAVAGTIQTLANDGADPGSMTVGALTSAEYLWVRSTALERSNAGPPVWTPTALYTTSGCNGTTGGGAATNMQICGEFRIATATTNTSNPTATAVDSASVFIAFREVARTVIADGSNPSNITLAPGAAITDLDAFTLRASTGTDSVTALTVTLTGALSFESLSEVRITSNDNLTTYFSAVANPASNTVAFSGGTPIPVTTTATTFKVRITPKTHAAMPVPPGLSYGVGGTVTAFTSTNAQSGTDSASATVTVDNLSPAVVTSPSCTAGAVQLTFGWTNPVDADYARAVVLRRAGVAVGDTPVEGTVYSGGETVGSSVVACVAAAPGTSCSDSTIATGTAYQYRIFAQDSRGNFSSTGATTGSTCTATLASFNVVDTDGHPSTGVIGTRIAGVNIAADIVARNSSNDITTDFTGTVGVELVDNTSGGACAGLPLVKNLSNQTFTAGELGRHPLGTGQFEAEAYRNLKFRIRYPVSSPTITSCSSDAFANRPLQFVNVLVRDANRTTAGTTNTLNNTSNPGTGTVHNAGRPFRIDATAQNGAGVPATTTNYTLAGGQPVVDLTQCGVAAVCPTTPGTLTPGTFSAASGVITTTTATYNNVGAFNLVIEDRTFTAVDSTDPGYPVPATHYISSAAVTVGRFVPDYFTLEAGSTITPRSDIGACSGSTFTYMSERMDLVFTLRARDAANNVTPGYSGATLGALALTSSASYSFGAIDSATPTPLTSRLDLSLIPTVTATWSAGAASITAPLAIQRAASPDGPYASLRLGIAPSDPDTVTLQASALNLDADNSGSSERAQVGGTTAVRFGRLRLQNAYGSELRPLPIPMTAQYWSGTAFITNSLDSCTSVSASNVRVTTAPAGVVATTGGPFASGVGSLSLSRPSPAARGIADVCVDLGADSPVVCTAASTPALTYLQGAWTSTVYDDDPSARAAFGVYGAQPRQFIFFRENY